MISYSVADTIIRIKNAVLARRKTVTFPYTKMGKSILAVLVKERFLVAVKEEVVDNRKVLLAVIAYDKRIPVFTDVHIVSKPSCRVYIGIDKPQKLQGVGLKRTVLSTSHGIMTGRDALKKKIGGELLFEIW